MSIVKIMLVAIATVAFHAAASAEEQQTDGKVYECGGEKMKLKELENGNLALEGKGLTGLGIHPQTYRDVPGGGRRVGVATRDTNRSTGGCVPLAP